MKTAPTETDREAARLFALAPGMRAWCRIDGAEVVARILGKDPVTMHAHAYAEALGMHLTESLAHNFDPAAIDTDDGPTQGAMMVQVEAALDAAGCPGAYLHPWTDGWAVRRGAAIRRYAGPTKGAALVAAKRALAEAAK